MEFKVYGCMVMNKISVSQTCLYNLSYQKATRFLQQTVATEGIWLWFGITLTVITQLSDSRRLLGGV